MKKTAEIGFFHVMDPMKCYLSNYRKIQNSQNLIVHKIVLTTKYFYLPRILKQVKIVQVIVPSISTPRSTSPVKVSVITTPPKQLLSTFSPTTKTPITTTIPSSSSSSPSEDPLKGGLCNGLPSTDLKKPASAKQKTPSTPRSPLSPEAHLDPANYQYVVECVGESAPRLTVRMDVLCRPKGLLSPKRMKIFLRNATCKPSEKHPLTVKV